MSLYEFTCENTACPNQTCSVEINIPIDGRNKKQKCEHCGYWLLRKVSGLKNKHSSWSSWTV